MIDWKAYQVRYTVDELGSRRTDGGSWLKESFDNLGVAKDVAEYLTEQGRCGFVKRATDGAVLADDGSWLVS